MKLVFIVISFLIAAIFSSAGAQQYDTKAMDKFAESEEVRLVKQHIISVKCVESPGAIDGCQDVIEISYITIPIKPRIYAER